MDGMFLYERGLADSYHFRRYTESHFESCSVEVVAAWAKAGIRCVTDRSGYNTYFDKNNEEISRYEAVHYVEKAFPKVRSI